MIEQMPKSINSNVLINKNGIASISFLILGVFVLFRGEEVGNDTLSYLLLYQEFTNASVNIEYYAVRFEIGYLLLNKICTYISSNLQTIIIISGLITTIGYWYFIKKYSRSICLSLLMFICLRYYDQTMNIIRECIAIAIIFYSYRFIVKRNFFKFIICILLATCFHKTAIVFTIAYFVTLFRLSKKTLLILFIVSMGFMFSFGSIFQQILQIFDNYSYYDGGEYAVGGIRIATILQLIIQGALFIISLVIRKNIGNEILIKRGYDSMLMIWAIAISITIVATQFNLLDRVAVYFNVFSIIVFPNILSEVKNIRHREILYILTITFLITYYCFILTYKPEWNRIYPYYFTTLL